MNTSTKDLYLHAPDEAIAHEFAANLCDADRRELERIAPLEPATVLAEGVARSEIVRSVYVHQNGKKVPMSLFGLQRDVDNHGVWWPWYVATKQAQRSHIYKSQMFPLSEMYREVWFTFAIEHSPPMIPVTLNNFVSVENMGALRYLQNLGFDVFAPQPYGVYGHPFCYFRKEIR